MTAWQIPIDSILYNDSEIMNTENKVREEVERMSTQLGANTKAINLSITNHSLKIAKGHFSEQH